MSPIAGKHANLQPQQVSVVKERRIIWIALGAVLVLGAILRFHGLTIQSYWLDELHSASFSAPSQHLKTVVLRTSHDAHPPLFQILLWFHYKIGGFSEFSGRAFSVVAGMAGLVLIYLLGAVLVNRKTGLFAAALTAPMFFHLFYSQEVRAYSLLFALTIASYLSLIQLIRKPDLGRTLLYAVAATALVYTHYFGVFVLIAQAILVLGWLIRFPQDAWRPFIGCCLTGLLVFLAFLPWLPFLFDNYLLTDSWIKPESADFVWRYFRRYFSAGFGPVRIIFPIMLILAFLPIVSEKGGGGNPAEPPLWWILASWIGITLALPWIITITVTPILIPRVTMITLPAVILILALPASRIRIWWLLVATALTVAILTYTLINKDRYYQRQLKENWRGAIQYVLQHDPNVQSPIVAPWSQYMVTYFHMLGHQPKVIHTQLFQPAEDMRTVSSDGGFWFMDTHNMKGPSAHMESVISDYFMETERAAFKKASAVFYRFRCPAAKARLVGAGSLPESGEIPLLLLHGPHDRAEKNEIQLTSATSSTTPPFLIRSGTYKVTIRGNGEPVNGKAPLIQVMIGPHPALQHFMPEQTGDVDGFITIDRSDVYRLKLQMLNPRSRSLQSGDVFDPGDIISIREGNWVGTWTRIEPGRYRAVWNKRTAGVQVRDTIQLKTCTPGQIVFYRKGLSGFYTGKLDSDGTTASGTADWYSPDGRWSMSFPGNPAPLHSHHRIRITEIRVEPVPGENR